MRSSCAAIAVVAALFLVGGAAAGLPRASVEVVRYGAGSPCVDLKLRLPGPAEPQVLSDVCHGWTTTECGDALMVDVHPVTQAHAVVLLPREGRTLDLTAAIDAEIRRRWPARELLHLRFARPTCGGGRLTAAFEASHAPAEEGAAKGLKGEVHLTSSATLVVRMVEE